MQIKFVANGINYQIHMPLGMRERAKQDEVIVVDSTRQRELEARWLRSMTRNYAERF